MSMTDPIGDMLTRIRNAQRAGHRLVQIPASTLKTELAKVLKDAGYVQEFQVQEIEGSKRSLQVELKYQPDGKPVIIELKRISKPGCRVYKGYTELKPVLGGFGIAVISTSKGIMTDKQARHAKLGGEVLCEVA